MSTPRIPRRVLPPTHYDERDLERVYAEHEVKREELLREARDCRRLYEMYDLGEGARQGLEERIKRLGAEIQLETILLEGIDELFKVFCPWN